MKSRIFAENIYRVLEIKVKDLLNAHEDFLSPMTANSPRATGDAIQDILARRFGDILGDLSAVYSSEFARRAMADLAFTDKDGFYYVVDVKTHRADTRFNMPNLTSVERLTRFYEDDKNYFCILMVSYQLQATRAVIADVKFVPIEFLSWECLTIGALGWGQIQIANSNHIVLVPQNSRKNWMLELCDIMLAFYPREIAKIHERIERFEQIKAYWSSRTENS